MTDFPLCRECGLEVRMHSQGVDGYVRAADVEALLSKAPVVSGYKVRDEFAMWENYDPSEASQLPTHTARLVNVREIKRDTAEGLLRELGEIFESDYYDMRQWHTKLAPLVERARRLLGGDK